MHTLVFLDPGHFHAALTLRERNPRVSDTIAVYAPDGPELKEFLALVDAFNRRAERPTAWRTDVRAGDHPLERLLAERPGDVVVLAGRNDRKAGWMRRLHEAGLHVLADKPWMTRADAMADIREVLRGGPRATEIMTGRHEIVSIFAERLVRERDVFGSFATGAPAIRLEGVHHLEKTVNGVPLRRPAWYFDVRVQGNGIADTPTHLVDQAQRLTAAAGETIELLDARLFATRVPLALFRRVTGADAFPSELRDRVAADALDYFSNTELRLRVCGVEVELASRWDLSVPDGGGDTNLGTMKGTAATVRVEQGPNTGFRRRLFVEPHGDASGVAAALTKVVAGWQHEYPGVAVVPAPGGFEIEIPAALRTGHESHFPLVLDELLRAIDDGVASPERTASTLAKYDLLARALSAG